MKTLIYTKTLLFCNNYSYCLIVQAKVTTTILILQNLSIEDEAQFNLSPEKQKATSKPPAFRLRVALRSTTSTQKTTEDDDEKEEEEEEAEEEEEKRGKKKRAGRTGPAWKKRRVKFEDEETAVARPKSEEAGCDSGEEVLDVFLAKREQNIKANKAMVNQKHRTTHCTAVLGRRQMDLTKRIS